VRPLGRTFQRREFVKDGAADDAGLRHDLARRVEHFVRLEAFQLGHREQFAENFNQIVDAVLPERLSRATVRRSMRGCWNAFSSSADSPLTGLSKNPV
jgi:hypothetical protein